MGFLSHLLYPWGIILQGLAIVHFIRRRPDTYWIFIILFLGPLGAIIYLPIWISEPPSISVGHHPSGTGDCPLYQAAARYLLDFHHPVSRSAGRNYLSSDLDF